MKMEWVMKNLASYGDRLEWAINKRNTSAAEVSKQTKINKSSISQYINGSTGAPRNTTSAKLANFLKINQYWLDTGEGEWDAESLEPINQVQQNMANSLLTISSPSVIDLMNNLREMEKNNKLTPELVSLLNATVDTFKNMSMNRPQATQVDTDNLLEIAKEGLNE